VWRATGTPANAEGWRGATEASGRGERGEHLQGAELIRRWVSTEPSRSEHLQEASRTGVS